MIKLDKEMFLLPTIYNTKSFKRTKNILDNIDIIGDNEANIEVDTVLYIKNPKGQIINEGKFVGKQINVQMIYVKDGSVTIEWNKKNKLNLEKEYMMIEDEEFYSGNGEEVTINSNELAIIHLDEAMKFKKIDSEKFMLIHISKYGGIK